MVGTISKGKTGAVCCQCGETGKTMLSVYAPGECWMCFGCIEATEERTGKQGVFAYWKGLVFVDDLERLEAESQAIREDMR